MAKPDKMSKMPAAHLDKITGFFSSTARMKDGTFNPGTTQIKIIKTHASILFLGAKNVYKIKQPVDYGYLDFSTLQKRFEACGRELKFNQPFAPDIYQKLVPVREGKDGKLTIGGNGQIIEWAVKMTRFDENNILAKLALEQKFDPKIAAKLGVMLANYHTNLPSFPIHNGADHFGQVIKNLQHNLNQAARQTIPFPFKKDQLEILFKRCFAFHKSYANHLDKRAKKGLIKRCHGDLHLNNIVLLKGQPTLFDCLEFNENLAQIDVLYDLAFLLMDLHHLNLETQANRLLSRYCLHGFDLLKPAGLKLVPLFMSIRATIRAMVCLQTGLKDQAVAKLKIKEANDYLKLAEEFLTFDQPKLIAVAGLSGSGKSTLARQLAAKIHKPLGAILIRSDLERKALYGASELTPLDEKYYTRQASDAVFKRMFERADTFLKQGHSVILDSVFLRQKERKKAQQIAFNHNVPFYGFQLEAPPPILLERVETRKDDASDAKSAVVKKQIEIFNNSKLNESDDWIKIDASGTKENSFQQAWQAYQLNS